MDIVNLPWNRTATVAYVVLSVMIYHGGVEIFELVMP
jgi:hypothetical protein